MNGREMDEVLEALWTCGEKNDHRLESLKKSCHVPIDQALLVSMVKDDLIACEGEMVLLTREGKGIRMTAYPYSTLSAVTRGEKIISVRE